MEKELISIQNKDFIQIHSDNMTCFGGNQSWWRERDNILCQNGCGVVAMCNLELYLNNNHDNRISYEEYIKYVETRYEEAYPISKNKLLCGFGLLPHIMRKGFKKFEYSKICWAPTINKKRIIERIYSMLEADLPIVASYYVFNKKRKLDLYRYDEVQNSLIKESGICSHYFNIVGMSKIKDKDMIIISSWGKKYYAYYDEWVKKLSIFTNILYVERENVQ